MTKKKDSDLAPTDAMLRECVYRHPYLHDFSLEEIPFALLQRAYHQLRTGKPITADSSEGRYLMMAIDAIMEGADPKQALMLKGKRGRNSNVLRDAEIYQRVCDLSEQHAQSEAFAIIAKERGMPEDTVDKAFRNGKNNSISWNDPVMQVKVSGDSANN